jgi:ribonuclease HII
MKIGAPTTDLKALDWGGRVPESFGRVCGIDEAGRGPLAGPVVAAAVIFPPGYCNSEIRDSKQLSPKRRDALAAVVKRDALQWAIVAVGHARIDRVNIREATRVAMRLALERVSATAALIDGNVRIVTDVPQATVVKGDQLFVQISAASILAKTHRDGLMKVLDQRYPGYSLAVHQGYPTASHREAISRLGPSRIHRITFAGVREFASQNASQSSFHAEVGPPPHSSHSRTAL